MLPDEQHPRGDGDQARRIVRPGQVHGRHAVAPSRDGIHSYRRDCLHRLASPAHRLPRLLWPCLGLHRQRRGLDAVVLLLRLRADAYAPARRCWYITSDSLGGLGETLTTCSLCPLIADSSDAGFAAPLRSIPFQPSRRRLTCPLPLSLRGPSGPFQSQVATRPSRPSASFL